MQQPRKVLFRVKEAAEALALSEATIYRMIADQRIMTTKIGGSRRIPATEVERLGRPA